MHAFRIALTSISLGLFTAPAYAGEAVHFPFSQTNHAWSASDVRLLKQRVDLAVRTTPLLGSHLGILAVDTERGQVLYAQNATSSFVPASTLKLLTGIVAIEKLGPQARFTTRLMASGNRKGSNLDGSVILRAGGDPELEVGALKDAANAVRAQGITQISNGIRIDTNLFQGAKYGAGWAWDDFPYEYAPPISALAINYNALHANVQPGSKIGSTPNVRLHADEEEASRLQGFRLVNHLTTGTSQCADTTQAWWGEHEIGVSGTIPLNSGPEDVAVAIQDPATFAHDTLSAYLTDAGIEVGSPKTAQAQNQFKETTLWTHDSPPLSSLLADMWIPSNNVIAEMLLRDVAGSVRRGSGSADAGVAVEQEFLGSLGVHSDGYMIVDGSGLSRENLITPNMLAVLLHHAWLSPQRNLFLNALPIAGVRGTLAHQFEHTALTGRVFAKTGSMVNISNLAGYLATYRHGPVTVVLMADNALIDDHALANLRSIILQALLEG